MHTVFVYDGLVENSIICKINYVFVNAKLRLFIFMQNDLSGTKMLDFVCECELLVYIKVSELNVGNTHQVSFVLLNKCHCNCWKMFINLYWL